MSLWKTLFQLISISCKTYGSLEYHYCCLLATSICFFHWTECSQLSITWSDGEDKTCRMFYSLMFYKSDCLTYSDLDQNCENVDLLEIWRTCSLVIQHRRDVDIHPSPTWCLKWSKYLCSQNFLDTWNCSLFPMSPYYNIFHKLYMGSLINSELEVCDRRVNIDSCTRCMKM